MKVQYGKRFGIDIRLTGKEIEEAINLWLRITGNLTITGPATTTVNSQKCEYGLVYVTGTVQTGCQILCSSKYLDEYEAYTAYRTALGLASLTYKDWSEGWERETPAMRELILAAYKLGAKQ